MAQRSLFAAATSVAMLAIFLGCHHVLGWSLRIPFLKSAFPMLSQTTLGGSSGPTDQFDFGDSGDRAWNIMYHLGGNSPWFRKRHGVASQSIDPPDGCRVEQVHMISRHSERYPTKDAGERMVELYRRMVAANVTYTGDLAFFNDWMFFTDEPADAFEDLVSTGPYAGTLEAFTTGVKLRSRYFELFRDAVATKATKFWASDSRRVIDSARFFGAGFFGIDWERLSKLVVISEGPESGADTLTPGRTCLDYRNPVVKHGRIYGYDKLAELRKSYEPAIVARLSRSNPEFSFNEDDVFTMQVMCGFEIIARGSSPWCDVFSEDEAESFEYSRDLLHYYRAGPGNPYGATMGWLWLNATANLLRDGPSAGPLFFSFVHDGDLVPLIAALEILPQSGELPITHTPQNRTWRTSDVVPMGGRLIFERISCRAETKCWSNAPLYPNHIYCEPERDDVFVRLNVNDGIFALPGCSTGPGHSCPLDEFLERVRRRGEEVGVFGKVCGLADGAADHITFLHQ